ncbi:MAG: prephenate dehydrogenase/arogenate dehydrogenase family protein [Methanomicrobiales archaeon]|nr:prephenate dehydrogenase/arogenate dehydrogenase family protein [Methanomicrobiales archaeon]MDI6875800.1 prephenate dehydrogenase/arogenate dehydrogenase family protein [Methanomicrobiales archaeon]
MQAGIIGGTGKMGGLFARVLERAGYRVRCTGSRGPYTNRELAEESDLVVVSVPIRSTVPVIREIASVLSEDQLLCDLTSLKVEPVRAMLASRARVVGLHPMFGPSAGSLRNQLVVATPARVDPESLESLLEIFRREGARTVLATPEEHDRMMAVVQGLVHFSTLCMAEAMRRQGVDIRSALAFTSPIYRIELGLVGRLLSQDPDLYGDMLQLNPFVPEVLAAFRGAAGDLSAIVEGGDLPAFRAFFGANARKYADYSPQAAEETDALIQFLVNR